VSKKAKIKISTNEYSEPCGACGDYDSTTTVEITLPDETINLKSGGCFQDDVYGDSSRILEEVFKAMGYEVDLEEEINYE